MAYIDGFLLAVPKNKLQLYKQISQRAGRLWLKYGALEYRECAGDDLKMQKGMGAPFTKVTRLKPREAVVFSWIVYKSRAHRDRVNAKVMSDPAMKKMMVEPMPFDMKRMSYGGFNVIVDL